MKFSYYEIEFEGKEVLRIDEKGNVFLDGKKIGYSNNLEKIAKVKYKEAINGLKETEGIYGLGLSKKTEPLIPSVNKNIKELKDENEKI